MKFWSKTERLAHNIAMIHVSKNERANTPEEIVDAFFEIYPSCLQAIKDKIESSKEEEDPELKIW